MKIDKVVQDVLGEELTLSPSDVLSQQFSRSTFGGYDRKEVDDFLERVAEVVEGLIVQVRALKERIEDQRQTIEELREMEASLRDAMLSSQRLRDDVIDAAKREANAMIEEAKVKKAHAQFEASKLPTALARDIHLMEQQRARLRIEILSILETHRKLIDSLVPEDRSSTQAGFFEVTAPVEDQREAVMELPAINLPPDDEMADFETESKPERRREDYGAGDPPAGDAQREEFNERDNEKS